FGLVPRRLSLSPPIRCAAPPPPAIYTLSLHDALPIYGLRDAGHLGADVLVRHPADPALRPRARVVPDRRGRADGARAADRHVGGDRKSTRLNSSHVKISYAVFCLKKKKHTIACSDRDA